MDIILLVLDALGLFIIGLILFLVVFIILKAVFSILKTVFSTRTYTRKHSSPHLTREAHIIGKRMYVSRYYTTYYITFEFSDKSRKEFHVASRVYGILAEGDIGSLKSQGRIFRGFERI